VSAETWGDDWLTADDLKGQPRECRCPMHNPAPVITEPAPDRTAEIDAYVDSLVIDAEGLAIRALVRAVVVLLILAVTFGLIHALGTVIGLIIPAAIAGLAGFIYLDQRRN